MDKDTKEIELLKTELKKLCTDKAVKIATQIMKKNPKCKRFLFNMGATAFYDLYGNYIEINDLKLDSFFSDYYEFINTIDINL